MVIKNKIKRLSGYRNSHRHFLNIVIENYSDFFEKVGTDNDVFVENIEEYGGDFGEDYWISIKVKVNDEQWEEFENISDKLKIIIEGNDTELNIFE